MSGITPRPEFGRPETGRARYWFRTDAQMKRAYMSPEERKAYWEDRAATRRERREQRGGLTRSQWAERQTREHERRRDHHHYTCLSRGTCEVKSREAIPHSQSKFAKENNDMKRYPIRQGDVLLVPVSRIPSSAKPKARDKGRAIIAYGEVTGHAHQIANPDAVGCEILTTSESATFVRLAKKAQLVHEEHAMLEVPAGTWQYVPQREYRYGESVRVAD